MKWYGGWALLTGLLVGLGLVGFAAAQQPRPGGTLRVAWEADVTGLDPHLSAGIQAYRKEVDALIDRMQEAPTEEAYRQAGYDFQRYVADHMLITSIASVPFLQAARTSVKGYEHLHGFKIRFETTWLEK